MNRRFTFLLVVAFIFLSSFVAAAERLEPKDVPDPLKPWTGWALHGKDAALCPTLLGVDGPHCAWPSRLALTLDEKGGRFTQSWHLDAKSWVPLPGDEKRWPQEVKVGAARAVVVSRSGVPSVELDKGDFTLTGALFWDSLPESLQVPPETGLLSLTLRGAAIEQPNRDAKGLVWLAKTVAAEEGERLEVVVHRKVADDIPLVLTTRITLNVAGKNREVLLGKALPAGFVPMALDAQLPARLEPDTRLRVQVRPGTWTIELTARSDKPTNELRRPKPEGPWREGDEVWVFDARNVLRLVDVQGVSAIDPQQTTLPEEWKKLPAYPMTLTDVMKLVEKRRGDSDPPPDHLTLSRTLWLDFDGAGLTASDTLTGTLRRPDRLEMAPPTTLGRVAISGKDQFITKLPSLQTSGVEVRQGELTVLADSRIVGDPSDIPAVGWNHDFHQVSGTLNLPPGWRLLYASGVDEVPGTWVKHWTLLEIFLVLVLAAATGRLYGWRWGALAGVVLVMTFPESDAPKWIWAVVLAAEALMRVLPEGRVKKVFAYARGGLAVLLVLVAVPFLIEHVREGLYPALSEQGGVDDSRGYAGFTGEMGKEKAAAVDMPVEQEAPPPPPMMKSPSKYEAQTAQAQGGKGGQAQGPQRNDEDKARAVSGIGDVTTLPASPSATSAWANGKSGKLSGGDMGYRQMNAEIYDPNAMVQTGPGRPRWQWTRLPLKWSGPVQKTQRLRLYLLSPFMNLFLSLLRAAAIVVLVLRLLPWIKRKTPGGSVRIAGAAAAAIAIAILPSPARAEIPSPEVLKELEQRLLTPAACAPSCASSARMLLEVKPKRLRVRVEVDAAASTAVPLPGSASQWDPADVVLDGQPAKSMLRTSDGRLWVAVAAGSHQIVLDGPMPERESMQLSLPLKPHRVEATTEGWSLEGLHEDGLADDDLQLKRQQAAGASASLQPGALPPFVRVERTLQVGISWQIQTRVVRLTPPGAAVVLEVPLLHGESVTTADVRVVGGKALVNMGPQATEVAWRSVLDEKSPIPLLASKSLDWIEVWRLDMSPIWHASMAGIPVIHADRGTPIPEWRPWPGESATIEVVRPDGVPGQTVTIDESRYEIDPGLRATDAKLTLEVRSSRGSQHTITLPVGAQLESVAINGATQPIRQEGNKVTLPLVPGSQTIVLAWREPVGISSMFSASALDLGVPSVNSNVRVAMSDSRWVLFLSGPRLGPTVLFWSLLVVLFVVATLLGRIRWAPLKTWQWIMLAIGLSQVPVVAGAVVVGWLLLLGWRGRPPTAPLHYAIFNLRQILIGLWTLVAMVLLIVAIHQGLLGHPDMQIRGNGSSSLSLQWFQDRSSGALPAPWILSTHILVYRAVMLVWALWLAFSVLRWLKQGWSAFGQGGMWRRAPRPSPSPATATAPPPVPPPPPSTRSMPPPLPPQASPKKPEQP